MKPRDRRGVALAVVLALLIVMGGIAAEVGRAVRLEAETVNTLRARTVARYAAESGAAVAEWRLQTLFDSAQSSLESAAAFRAAGAWLERLAQVTLGDAQFEVSVVDLNARVDLNRSGAATLQGLLGQFTDHDRAAKIAAAIKSKPLYRVGELALVPGMDDALAAAVAPYVTVWGDGTININSAPEPVLAALPDIGGMGAKSMIMRRESGEIFGSAASIRPEASMPAALSQDVEDSEADPESEGGTDELQLRVSTAPTRILVVSRGWKTGHPLTHEIQAVYAAMGTRLTLQIWQERDL